MDLQYTKALVAIGARCKLPRGHGVTDSSRRRNGDPKVNVFRRFALMKRWVEDGIAIGYMDDQGSDRLHTSKWATNCVAQALSEAIINARRRFA